MNLQLTGVGIEVQWGDISTIDFHLNIFACNRAELFAQQRAVIALSNNNSEYSSATLTAACVGGAGFNRPCARHRPRRGVRGEDVAATGQSRRSRFKRLARRVISRKHNHAGVCDRNDAAAACYHNASQGGGDPKCKFVGHTLQQRQATT